jgi:hypothetical protein
MAIIKWAGGSGTSFDNNLNWSPHSVPTSSSDVIIQPAAPVTITAADDIVNSLVTGSAATLAIEATSSFTIVGARDAANPGGVSVNAGTINLGGAADLYVSGTFDNKGLLNSQATSDIWLSGTLANTGTVHQAGDLNVGNATVAGIVSNAKGAQYALTGAVDIVTGNAGSSLNNAGTFTRGGSGVSDVTVATINSGNISVGSGRLEFLGSLMNTGVMTVSGATLYINRAIQGTGKLNIGGGGSLQLVQGKDAGQTVGFLGAGTLDLNAAGSFAGLVTGFGAHDAIDLINTAATSASYSAGVLTVHNGGSAVAHLDFAGSYASSNFALSSDGHHGTLISFH